MKVGTVRLAVMMSVVTLALGCAQDKTHLGKGPAQAAEQPPQYAASCGACHAYAAAGAPKTGDVAQWEPRLAKGMEALVLSVKNGLGVMPAGGMCATCSDDEYKALISYMSTPQ